MKVRYEFEEKTAPTSSIFNLYHLISIVLGTKSKFNNTAHLLVVKFLAAFFQPTHTIVSYLLLIHGLLISLTKFLGSCA